MILLFRYKTRGRQAGLGVPQVPQPRPEQAERCPPHLRLHRHPVLEPGPHRRNQGPRAAFVKFSIYKAAFLWRAAFLFLLSAKFADLIFAFLTFCRWYGILFINEVIPWTTFPSLKRQKGGICRNVR